MKEYITKVNADGVNYLSTVRECPGVNATVNQPEFCVDLINKMFDAEHLAEEHVYMIAANAACQAIGVFEVSHGAVSFSLCNPRELLIRALLSGASMAIILHNHPSGNITPSEQDIQITKTCTEAFKLIGIPLADHIIIGQGCSVSLRREGFIS